MKDKEKRIKIKGYIGLCLLIILLILGKTAHMFEISEETRYYLGYIFLFSGAFCIWLSSDLLNLWFDTKNRR